MPCVRITAESAFVLGDNITWNIVIEHEGEKLRRLQLRDPFTAAQERECKWYLERYTRSPFALERAAAAEKSFREYGQNLLTQLGLSDIAPLWSKDKPMIDIEVIQRADCENDVGGLLSVHRLHWEFLEDGDLWIINTARVSVRRVLAQKETTRMAGIDQEKTSIRSRHPNSFNVLLVVARDLTIDGAAYEDVDASNGLRALLYASKSLNDSASSFTLNVEVVRPGALPALEEHLSRYERGHFDLVHFDIHGIVRKARGAHTAYLMFADTASATDLSPVHAETVGILLSERGVRLAVLNACNSARSDRGMLANVASNLVTQGVTNVLAMTYEFMASAVPLFFNVFYQCFFLQGMPFSHAAAISRHNLKRHPERTASFGLTVGLQDWSVPTIYTADQDVMFTYSTTNMPKRALRDFYSEVVEPNTSTYETSVIGRDLDKLRFERELIENKALYLYGVAEGGKSAMLDTLANEWRLTNFAEVVQVDFSQVPYLTQELMIEQISLQLDPSISTDAASSKSLPQLMQVFRQKRTVLVFDSLDTPYSYMIQESHKETNVERYNEDYAKVHEVLRSLIELALDRSAPEFYVVLVGRKERYWIQEQLPGLDVSSFELPALSLPAAISLSERILVAHGFQYEALRQSDSLVHIVQMLQKLPGALRLVLPKASKNASLDSFREGLLHGDVTLTVADLKGKPFTAHRFLRNLNTLDYLQLQIPLVSFWGEGPANVEYFVRQLRDLGLDYGEKWLTIFFCLNDLDACSISREAYFMRWVHPMWTLLLRGKQQSSFHWRWQHSNSLQPLRAWVDKGRDYLAPGSSQLHSSRLPKMRELFCSAVQDRFKFFFNFQVLGANNVPRYGRYHRGSLSNVLSVLDICCDEEQPLQLTKWPMELFTGLTALSRIYFSVPEQLLFNQGLERALKIFTQRNGGFAVETDLLSFPLIAATHLRTFYGPDRVRALYRPELTDIALAVIEASESKYGIMPRYEMMYKGLAFRYKAIDMLIAKDEKKADAWWKKMNAVDSVLYPSQTNSETDVPIPAPSNELSMEQQNQVAIEQFTKINDERLRSWLAVRGPSFWDWLKSTILQKDMGGKETELLQEMSTNLRQASNVYEQTGVLGLDRWEFCFPMQSDMVQYTRRLEDPKQRLLELEEAIETGSWEKAYQHHMELYNAEFAEGHFQAARKHLLEAREIYVKNIDEAGEPALWISLASHNARSIHGQMVRNLEYRHQRIEESIMAGEPIDWDSIAQQTFRELL